MISHTTLTKFINEQRKPFNCEFSFQFSLAWFLYKNFEKDIENIEFESRVYTNEEEEKCGHDLCRCDLVIYKKNNNIISRILIELKYVVEGTDTKSSGGHRSSFIKDLYRLNNNNNAIKNFDNINKYNDERYCIFITDKTSIYRNGQDYKSDLYTDKFNKTFGNYNDKSPYKKYWIKGLNTTWGNRDEIQCLLVDAKNFDLIKFEDYYEKNK